MEGETNLFMGLKLQLIYEARLAVFPRITLPGGLRGACRWLLQPGLRIGSHLTAPRKKQRERGMMLVSAESCRAGAGRRRRGVPQGCCCQSTHDYEPVTAPRGRGAGGAVLPSLPVEPGRVSVTLQWCAQNLLSFQAAKSNISVMPPKISFKSDYLL